MRARPERAALQANRAVVANRTIAVLSPANLTQAASQTIIKLGLTVASAPLAASIQSFLLEGLTASGRLAQAQYEGAQRHVYQEPINLLNFVCIESN